MPEPDRPPRRFSDEEVRIILARAAKLQELAPPAPSAMDGLSLRDLEQVAEEAGISRALVRRAAAEVDVEAGGARGGLLLGHPSELRFQYFVPGEVPSSAFPRLTELIESRLDLPGQPQTAGSSLRWYPVGAPRLLQVAVVPEHGRTTIRITERLSPLIGGLFGGIVGGAGGGLGGAAAGVIGGVLGSLWGGLLAAGLAVVGSWWLARSIFVRVARRRREQLAELGAELNAEAERLASRASPA
jgi:hypothetical protein